MPTSVYVSLIAPEGVPATPRRFHAALCRVLDLPPGSTARGLPRTLTHRTSQARAVVRIHSGAMPLRTNVRRRGAFR